ncbi:MAG: YceI family protein [candidate division NC10 bacterium]|nr:YceI family protein [candidate division NC10 bacterium]MBI2115070.1 YceI family protein [candidate division NC10 bacterium]MBI2458763.1 YceI family protein [candidate division NC10 bacterium]MBI3087246.1 YceI family protein [candidate division NC10 bacterium]
MKSRIGLCSVVLVLLAVAPVPALAQQMTFRVLPNSRATFKTDAALETVIGNTSGPAVSGTVMGDPAKPQAASGTIRVDLTTLKTGIEKRDADMRGKDYLDTDTEVNRYAVFELKGVEIGGVLQPGKEMPARLKGILTIKGKPVEVAADAQVTYIKLTPDQLETQKRFGFTADNVRVKAKFNSTFTNHGMQIPQLLFLKLSNDIQLETDLTLVRQ